MNQKKAALSHGTLYLNPHSNTSYAVKHGCENVDVF